MPHPVRAALFAGCGLVLAGCAGAAETPLATGTAVAAGSTTYTLNADELKLDCKKLAGRMQVRLLQLRGHGDRKQASAIGRTMQKVATPVFGGSSAGIDPDQRYADDVATLKAYNARLAELKCATYDLDKELTAKPGDPTPQPVPLPKDKAGNH